MTRITKLTLQGFKSFANKTDLMFGPGYNCILGPNGSGKSNVLDSLCFVLGKSSAKSMRAEKTANLIYNGGKSKNPAKDATVKIHFDNSDKTFPIEENEVVISRTVHENGNSSYKINTKTVTRNQILELLVSANLNPDGYNIILQGDITNLIEMSSIERRKIIEEIAGISVYEEKKQKALSELTKVEDKVKEAEIILAEREGYLKELKKERNQALKFKELDDKIRQNKATMISLKISKKQDEIDRLKKNIESSKAEITKIEAQIAETKTEIESKRKAIEKINKEIEDKSDKEQLKIQKDIEQLKVDVATGKTKVTSIETEITRIKSRKDQLQKSMGELKDNVDRLNKDKDSISKKVKDNEALIKSIEAKVEAFKKKHNLEDGSLMETEIEKIDKQAEEKQAEISKLRESQQNLLREKDKYEYQIQSADEKIAKVMEIQKENETELKNLKNLKDQFKKATVDLNIKLNEDSSIVSQLSTARNRLLKIKEDLAKARGKQANVNDKMASGMAVQKILEMKDKIRGIIGTVTDLGQVENRFAMAMEVAAGSKLKSIVVDSDKTAAECIQFLKKNRLGTATFLPLNTVKPVKPDPETEKALKHQGVYGRAMDLIKYESKYRNIYSYVLGDTIIVDNIDTARKIGIGSVRMVTIEGDLADKSGAMQGGFRQRTQGLGFQQKEVHAEIEELEHGEADTESIIGVLERRKKEVEAEIQALRESKMNLEGDILKIEKTLHLESGDLEVSKNLKKEMQDKSKEMDKELDEVIRKISKMNRELADLKIGKQTIKNKIMELRNPAVLAELNTFEQKRSDLKEENLKLSSELKSIEVQLETIFGPELANTTKILKQHDKEEEHFLSESKKLTEEIERQEKELKVKEKAQKEFYAEFKDLFKKRDTFSSELNDLEKKLYQRDDTLKSNQNRQNIINLDLAKAGAELSSFNDEFKAFEGVPIFKDKPEEEIKKEIWQFEKMVADIGAVNMRALEIYDAVEKEFQEIIKKKETLLSEREKILLMMNEIEAKKRELFMVTFDVVNKNFQEIFAALSTKGETFLELEDPNNIFEAGMNIKVKLTGTKFMDLRSLSGGEKTMTALAFLFSVQEHNPAPFYIMDEVDAALDKRNSERLAELIKKYSDRAQYLIISHNDGVISSADTLYGVSMDQHGISKVVSLRI